MDAQQEQYQSDLQSLGDGIASIRAGACQCAEPLVRMDNIALWAQLGRVTRELETFERMVQQHRMDRG